MCDSDRCEDCGEMVMACICEHVLNPQPEICPWCSGDMNDEGWCEYCDHEDDGQPDEYTEWQDLYGGDDWDHGQYDEY